jgi:hypothetical protein
VNVNKGKHKPVELPTKEAKKIAGVLQDNAIEGGRDDIAIKILIFPYFPATFC